MVLRWPMQYSPLMELDLLKWDAAFLPDGRCGIPPFLKVKSFLSLIDGNYREINACSGDDKSEMCLDCDGVEWT
jgi:hypothetical protein